MKKWHMASAVVIVVASYLRVPENLLRAQAPGKSGSQGGPLIEIQARIETASQSQVVLKVGVRNVGASPVYLATDPQRVDRSKGPYIDTDKADPATLICTLQFYPPDPFEAYVNGTGVHLTRLAPGESHDETLKLTWPMRSTAPPWPDSSETKVISAQSIKRIEVRIGVLQESASLIELIQRKRPPYDGFTGLERIKVGSAEKSLYEIQHVASSNLIEVTKPLTGDSGAGGPVIRIAEN